MKRLLSILLSLVLSFMLVGCGGAAPSQQQQQQQTTQQSTSEQKTTGALAVIHEKKFGGVYLDITIDEFNALGFEYGDSCDVTFSNGYKLEDIPYYNGYYSKTGHPLISAYPGFPHIDVCVNNGGDCRPERRRYGYGHVAREGQVPYNTTGTCRCLYDESRRLSK